MRRRELKQGESTAEMEIFIKHLVITFASKFQKNESLATRYGQNTVCVVKG